MNADNPLWLIVGVVGCFLATAAILSLLFQLYRDRAEETAAEDNSLMNPKVSILGLLIYGILGAAAFFVLAVPLQMPFVGLVAFVGALVIGFFQQEKARREAIFKFEEGLPTLLARWSNDMAGGLSFDRAVQASYADATPLIRQILAAILPKLGEDPVSAFQDAQMRMERRGVRSEAFAMVVAVVSAGARAGKLGPALASVSEALQDVENLKLKVAKESESGRRNVALMMGLGVLIAIAVNVIELPGDEKAAPTVVSQIMFGMSIAMVVGAWIAAYLVSRSKV
ncbi:hypothetical protein ACMU_08905 [Actibacterium mucosum KCTC 23349]|uniref:Type II secretion system protein GspF domain-containing protein n=1 Tax=Actibacterium mucosum KCTC 23349 TaxID=1454373 RepID=A0A037ZK05_9RHOB|nr:hypothetical protein [Actibacterium mucosum]KAJ55877.1 hypothetical protein ACMU_08905 [Actibacterium mucosum KCTC 23349]